jgi:hypothetical protein
MQSCMTALITVLFICVSQNIYAESKEAVAKKFVGTWRLVSTEQKLADGSRQPNPLLGPNGQGYLIYGDSVMCGVLVNPDRPKWGAEQSPTDQELRQSMKCLVAYCGKYEVNSEQGYVVHHVEVDSLQNAAGIDRKRYFSFQDNRLILTLAPPLPEGVQESSLTWERVKK